MSKPQTNFRNARPSIPYTPICNELLQTEAMSVEAIGFVSSMLSRKADWTFQREWVRKTFKIGETKLERILRETKKAGFSKVLKDKDENGRYTGSVTYLFTDIPGEFGGGNAETGKTADMEEPKPAKTVTGKTRVTGNHPPIERKDSVERKEREKDSCVSGDTPDIQPLQAIEEPSPQIEPVKAKRKAAAKGCDLFEAAWIAYRTASGRSPGSKTKALAAFQKLSSDDQVRSKEVIAAYAADCASQKFGRGETRAMADMVRFLRDFFDQFKDAAEEADFEAQVLDAKLAVQAGNWSYAARRGWNRLSDIPERVMSALKNLLPGLENWLQTQGELQCA